MADELRATISSAAPEHPTKLSLCAGSLLLHCCFSIADEALSLLD